MACSLTNRLRIKLSTAIIIFLCISAFYMQQRYLSRIGCSENSDSSDSGIRKKECTCTNNRNAPLSIVHPKVKQIILPNRTTPAGVPMLLHFVYKDSNILEAYRTGVESCIKMNRNWTVILWTDESVKLFIAQEFPKHKTVFYGFRHKIQRSDAIRYLILYKFGGVYIDLDMKCTNPLLASLSDISCFLDREREHQTQVIHGRQYSAMNSAMGCIAGHPFFKKLIDFVLSPERLRGDFIFPRTIFATTGPLALTWLFDEWNASKSEPIVVLLAESYFSPKVNPRSGVYDQCRNVVKSISRTSTNLTIRDKACLDVERLGFEKSDDAFMRNVTVAIHEFTHLGYSEQNSATFDIFKSQPGVLLYADFMHL